MWFNKATLKYPSLFAHYFQCFSIFFLFSKKNKYESKMVKSLHIIQNEVKRWKKSSWKHEINPMIYNEVAKGLTLEEYMYIYVLPGIEINFDSISFYQFWVFSSIYLIINTISWDWQIIKFILSLSFAMNNLLIMRVQEINYDQYKLFKYTFQPLKRTSKLPKRASME